MAEEEGTYLILTSTFWGGKKKKKKFLLIAEITAHPTRKIHAHTPAA